MNDKMNDLMNCDRFADRLADFLERDVPESTRAAMEAHALSCGDCGPLLADLRRLRIDAANLPELVPSRDLWNDISARIETPIVELQGRSGSDAVVRRRRITRQAWLGLAAAGLVAATATITHEVTRRSIAPVRQTAAATSLSNDSAPTATLYSPPSPAAASVSSAVSATVARDSLKSTAARTPTKPAASPTRLASNTKPSAEETYDAEITKLRAVLKYRRHDLDSTTVAVVDKNLKIIDDAIAQCRLALKKDPASRYLMQSLNEALDNKVQLLRTAATLPPRA